MNGDVLVPVDGSEDGERALRVAAAIARELGGRVSVVRFIHMGSTTAAVDLLREQIREQAVGVPVDQTVKHISVPTADAIRQFHTEHPGYLLCIPTHGRGRSAAVLGSVALDLIHDEDRSILLVGPKCDGQDLDLGQLIIAPLDGEKYAEAALDVALAWARIFGSVVKLVSVVDSALVPAQARGDVLESSYLHRVWTELARTSRATVDFDVLHDQNPGRAIARAANDSRAAVISMASRGLTGLDRVRVGSVTSDVLREARCPVLVTGPNAQG